MGNGNAIHEAGIASRAVAQLEHGKGVGRCGELRIEGAVNGVRKGGGRMGKGGVSGLAHVNAFGTRGN
jgi:hypothetical protein